MIFLQTRAKLWNKAWLIWYLSIGTKSVLNESNKTCHTDTPKQHGFSHSWHKPRSEHFYSELKRTVQDSFRTNNKICVCAGNSILLRPVLSQIISLNTEQFGANLDMAYIHEVVFKIHPHLSQKNPPGYTELPPQYIYIYI